MLKVIFIGGAVVVVSATVWFFRWVKGIPPMDLFE